MKFQKKNISLFLLFFFSIIFSAFIWSKINFPTQRNDIVGEYSLNNYNSLNDILRYVIFISLPTLTFFISKILIYNISFKDFFNSFKIIYEKNINEKPIIYLLFFLLAYIITEFLSLSFPLHEFDIYHEGQRLSSAYRSLADGTLWTGSYVTVGIIYETLGSKFIWQIFNKETIGLVRFLDLIYIFITKLLLIILFFEITKTTKLNTIQKLFFFLITTITSFYLINYNLHSADNLHFREIPILLSLIIIFKSLNKSSLLLNFALGFLSLFVFLWSIDRGLVYLILLIFFLFFLLYNKRSRDVYTILIFVFLFWISFYFLDPGEFFAFTANTISVFEELTYVHGIIHPIPFTDADNSSRATKNIIVILFAVIFSLNFLTSEKKFHGNYFRLILFFLSLVSFFSYLYALGRSDGPHLKQAFGFPGIFIITVFTYFLIYKISYFKKIFNNFKIIEKIPYIIILCLIVFNSNYTKILNFKERFINYSELGDDKFLNETDILFVDKASKIFKDEKCIQLFTNDAALLYLLKKPSCTKHYYYWSIGSKKNQLDLISSSKDTRYIIVNGSTDYWSLPLEIKYPILHKYINKNFNIVNKIGNRSIFLKKN